MEQGGEPVAPAGGREKVVAVREPGAAKVFGNGEPGEDLQPDDREEKRGENLENQIARRDARLAVVALAAEHEPAQDGDVEVPRDELAA